MHGFWSNTSINNKLRGHSHDDVEQYDRSKTEFLLFYVNKQQ